MGWLALIPEAYRGIARIAVIAAVLMSAVGGYWAWAHHQRMIGEARANVRCDADKDELRRQAAATLQTETNKVNALQLELGALRASQEKTDAVNSQTVAALRDDLRRRSRAAGGPGLRDPNAAGCGGGRGGAAPAIASGAVDSPADGTETGRLLSPELERLLLDRLEEADVINNAYASCRPDAMNIRRLTALQ